MRKEYGKFVARYLGPVETLDRLTEDVLDDTVAKKMNELFFARRDRERRGKGGRGAHARAAEVRQARVPQVRKDLEI